MKILLVGEYSNVHWTLAEGLRALGHDVTVVSDGDSWKNYPRDIDLRRRSLRKADTLRYLCDIARIWPTLRGYDVVQLINPVFLDIKAEHLWPFYRYLRRHNGRMVLGALGIDYFWVRVGMDCRTFRYSDFNIGPQLRSYPFMDEMVATWLHGAKGELNRRIADDCDAIVTGLCEYDMCYRPFYPDKARHIPFPINRGAVTPVSTLDTPPPPLRCFIGIQRQRSAYKGTDIMLAALQQLKADYPDAIDIVLTENVPYALYQQRMNGSHVLLDQLYSYTPAMNGLLALAKGLILVGGGEEEHYRLLGEQQLRPIINVQPTQQDVYEQIRQRLLLCPQAVNQLQRDGIEYIRRHHDHIDIARQYEALYSLI